MVPWNHATWTSVTFEEMMVAASGGEPRDFGLAAPLEFVVTYS